MEEKLLVEKKRTVMINSEMKKGPYRYDVNHEYADSLLNKLSCNIYVEETGEYVGYMNYENGNSNFSFPKTQEVVIHVETFQEIIAEVQEALEE